MSIQVNHYVAHGLMLPYKEAKVAIATFTGKDDYDLNDVLDPYYDSAFEGVHHHNGLCVIPDGMCGKYFFVGRVFAKSKNHEGFDSPIEIPSLDKGGDDVLQALIKSTLGLEGEIKSYAFSHYR